MSVSLLEAARLMLATYRKVDPPDGWEEIDRFPQRLEWFAVLLWTGVGAATFYCQATGEVVVAYKGQQPWFPGSWASMARRRIGERLHASGLEYAKRQPRERVTVIGHSAGGATASWVGAELDRPSICFASARVGWPDKWSFKNDGAKQTWVYVEGDPFGDPYSHPEWGHPLRGRPVRLKLPKGMRPHFMPTYIAALEAQGEK